MDDHSKSRIEANPTEPLRSVSISAVAPTVPAQAFLNRFVAPAMRRFGIWGKLLVTKWEALGRRAPLRFSLLTAAGLVALVLSVLSPSYQTNDDLQLTMIAAGKGACLAPDEHLIFTNVVIGHVLKSLYVAWPAIPWYGIYLYLAQYLALAAILYCTIAPGYTRLRLGMYLLFFATVGVFFLINLQYTMTAFLAGQSGGLLCLVALRRQAAGMLDRAGLWMIACGVAMLVLASLIRLDCLYLTLLLLLPAVLCTIGWPPRRAVLLSATGTGGMCLGLVLGLAAYNDAYYARDAEWRSFQAHNKLRIKFNDYGWTNYTPQTAAVFEKVQWSENDHAMIANWFFDDPVVYSETRLRQLLESYPWQSARLTLEYGWNCLDTILDDRTLWSVALMLPLFLACAIRSRENMTAYVGTAILALTVFGTIALFNKIPPKRVYFPLLTFPLTLLLVMAGASLPKARAGGIMVRCVLSLAGWTRQVTFRATLVHALAFIAVVYGVSRHYRSNHRMQRARHDFLHTIKDLDWRSDRLYAVCPSGFRYELISPFDNLKSFSNFHHLVIGWPQRTPFFEAMKRQFNVEDLMRALHERPDVFAVGYGGCYRSCAKYMREHHGVDVDFVWKHGDGYPSDFVAQFERRTRSDNTSTADRAASPLSRQ